MRTAEYLRTPETVLPRELAFGVMRVAEAPRASHQRVVVELLLALAPFVRSHGLGEVLPAPIDVILDYDAHLVVQPDLVFVSTERADIVADQVHGAPDMAIEVLSPRPRVGQLDERLGWFARYGVRECWIADQQIRRISVVRLEANAFAERAVFSGAERIESAVLAGVPVTPLQIFGF